MARLTTAVIALVLAFGQTAAAEGIPKGATEGMGPAAFMWPPDRVWSAAADNTAPCGSIAGIVNRTTFPLRESRSFVISITTHLTSSLENGKVALVAQDESYDIELAISYLAGGLYSPSVIYFPHFANMVSCVDPQSNSDFKNLIDMETFREMEMGHTCVPVDDAPDSVKAGANATLQIKYIADWDKPENQTFYACADITYVELADFQERIPCFNATQPSDDDENTGGSKGDKTGSGSESSSTSSPSASKGKSGLSGGAIAGIVIGSLAGVAALALAGFFVYRRKQQRMSVLRQQHTSRGVKWDERERDSASNGSVRMNNL